MADNIVVSYKDNLDEITRNLKTYRDQQLGISKGAEDFGNKSKAATDKANAGLKETGKQTEGVGNLFNKLGAQIAAAFSVAAVIAFGKATVDAFIKAELSAKKLQTAVGAGGGLHRDFAVLLQQSKELQKTTIFNDETIQDAQTMALQFGFNAQAVKDLIPLIIDFASATGQDLGSALSTVLRGTTGQTRGLKVYGVEVSSSATRTEKFASIVQQLTDKFQGQGKVVGETAGGRLKQLANAWDELKESIGGAIAPLVAGAASLAKNLLSIVETPLGEKLEKERISLSATTLQLDGLNVGSKERVEIIKRLQAQYPDYLKNIDAEKVSNEELQRALKNVNDSLILKIALAKGDEAIAKSQETLGNTAARVAELRNKQLKELDFLLRSTSGAAEDRNRQELKGLSTDEKVFLILNNGIKLREISGDRLRNLAGITKELNAEQIKLAGAEIDLSDATKERITQEKLLTDILGIKNQTEKLSGGGDFLNKTEEEIKAEAEAAKKIQEAKEKAAKEAADAVAKIDEDNFKLAEDNLKKFQAEQIALIEGQNISREEKEKAFTQLELDVLNARRQNYIDYGKDIGDIDVQIANKHVEQNKTKEKSDKDFFDELEKQRRKGLNDAIDAEERRLKEEEDAAEKRKRIIQEVFDLAAELSQSLNDLFNAQNEADIERINANRDAAVEAIDEQIDALEEANHRGQVSDRKLEQQKKALLEQRMAAEKKADEERRKIQRKEAENEKLFTLFKIGLELAEAIATLNVVKIIAATAELAVVIATPIPAFAKGTKGKKQSGPGLVGEEGPEFLWMDKGAKVVPADRTRRYREAIDTMIEGTFDEKYVYKAMIASAIREATRQAEKQKQKTFAENVANLFNVKAEIDPYRLADGIKSNNKELAYYIGKAVAKNLNNHNPNDRYYH